MKAQTLIEYLRTFDADAPVMLSQWSESKGLTEFFDVEVCCNTEHQELNGEVWLRRGLWRGDM